MSASREKNKRKEQAQSGTPEVRSEKTGMSKGGKTALGIVIAVVVVAAIVLCSMLSSGFFAKNTTAATIGEHKLSPAMVNFYSGSAYSSFTQTYSDYVSLFFDTSKSLDSQVYDEETGETWGDYFLQQGLTSAAQTYAVYDDAIANGFTLTEEQEASIDSQLSSLESFIKLTGAQYGYNTVNSYLVAQYGTGCTEKLYREFLYVNTLAQAYTTSVSDGMTYTEDQLDEAYAADPSAYDGVTYRSYYFSSADYADDSTDSDEELTEEQQEAQTALQMAAAKTDADAMLAAITDEQSFIDLSLEYAPEDSKETYQDESATLKSDIRKSSCPTDLADWLFDSARAEGDTNCVETTSGYYVVYYLSRDTHDALTKNVRHILISVSDTSDESAVAEAHAKAEAILAEYQSGEQTEDAFAALSEKYLNDGTAAEAREYENVYPGQMVEEFENWCYDESRQPGDTGVVDSSYGSHVMYFCGDGDRTYRSILVENTLHSNDYNDWYNALTENATYTESAFGMKLANKR